MITDSNMNTEMQKLNGNSAAEPLIDYKAYDELKKTNPDSGQKV